ncbi:MAG: aldehyde dehydrogenase [Mycobacteriales bacterium]
MDHVVQDRLFIGGEWRAPASAATLEVLSASTEQHLGQVPAAAEPDLDAAVAAARAAQDDPTGWAHWAPEQRAQALLRLASELESRAGDIVQAVSAQNGMPVSVGKASEGVSGPSLLRYYAALSSAEPVEEHRAALSAGTTIVRKDPVGVVAAIVPWNFPQSLTWFKLAPALAAGCCVVLKPSPETVLDAQLVAEAVRAAALPPGVVNVVPGGREAGAYLVSHPLVDKVAFTGSTSAGRVIAETCGRLLRPVTLELGGKSAAVVLEDADLTGKTSELFAATLLNSGQTCFLSTRVLAPRSRYRDVVDLMAGLAQSLRVGEALDSETQIGPLATRAQRTRVEGFVQSAHDEGARLVTGGRRPTELSRGWFYEPTVFADVDNRSQLAEEEVSGPVLAVTPYDSVDEAIAMANDSSYGLGGTVWTEDEERGLAVARHIRTGTFGINGYRIDPGAPFGGVKASGLGRELGPEGLASYQQLKSVYLPQRSASAR